MEFTFATWVSSHQEVKGDSCWHPEGGEEKCNRSPGMLRIAPGTESPNVWVVSRRGRLDPRGCSAGRTQGRKSARTWHV